MNQQPYGFAWVRQNMLLRSEQDRQADLWEDLVRYQAPEPPAFAPLAPVQPGNARLSFEGNLEKRVYRAAYEGPSGTVIVLGAIALFAGGVYVGSQLNKS